MRACVDQVLTFLTAPPSHPQHCGAVLLPWATAQTSPQSAVLTLLCAIHLLYLELSLFNVYWFLGVWKGERKRGRTTSMWKSLVTCLSYVPRSEPNPEPRHVPWEGTEPVAFCFTGLHIANWATPVMATVTVSCKNTDLIKALCCLTTFSTPTVWDGLQCRLTLLCWHPCCPLVLLSPSLHPLLYPARRSCICMLLPLAETSILPLFVHKVNCSLWRSFFIFVTGSTLFFIIL